MQRLAIWIIFAVLFAGGCTRPREDKWTRARPRTHRVTGRVVAEGVPIAGAKVVFFTLSPVNGRDYSAFGYTDARGRFTLQTFRDGDGAVAGEHHVTIEKLTFENPASSLDAAEVRPPKETSHLPERYRSPKTSGLNATVDPKGRNTFVFSINGT